MSMRLPDTQREARYGSQMVRPSPAVASLVSLLFGLSLGGCSESSTDAEAAEADASDAWVEIGTGLRPMSYEPVEDGSRLDMVYGLQGGYHIWAAFEGGGFSPRGVNFRFTLYDGDRRGGFHRRRLRRW